MELTVRVPGSCGEVMQGIWQDEPFLVTCPIDRYSTVVVRPGTGRLVGGGDKARRALALGRAWCRCDRLAYDFFLTSELPPGKGMASSSADICAVLAAVAAVNHVPLSEGDIGRLAASIEPTDGVFCQGMALIQPETGDIQHVFTDVPPLAIAVFDAGGTVDTVAFHKARPDRARTDAAALYLGWQFLSSPMTDRNLGLAASLSALANQSWLPKPDFPAFLRSARRHPAVAGVNVAHSGTVAGVFFCRDACPASQEVVITSLSRQFPQWTYVETVHLRGGGISIENR
ncbi:MAG: GHMP kinase [Megasphaera sp.]|uniref:GHMP family kinase ATP-binding protein n=1 Tax=Megasphaera sp. TaxID=2023260 RepID=UPI0025BE1429|nr:GHMP kinase [Megasphaera sp.]MCF0151785.1 GHMP kinase [Megasphaera sp.]MCI7600813.1 GHMP kinase [Megasphaera sp.]